MPISSETSATDDILNAPRLLEAFPRYGDGSESAIDVVRHVALTAKNPIKPSVLTIKIEESGIAGDLGNRLRKPLGITRLVRSGLGIGLKNMNEGVAVDPQTLGELFEEYQRKLAILQELQQRRGIEENRPTHIQQKMRSVYLMILTNVIHDARSVNALFSLLEPNVRKKRTAFTQKHQLQDASPIGLFLENTNGHVKLNNIFDITVAVLLADTRRMIAKITKLLPLPVPGNGHGEPPFESSVSHSPSPESASPVVDWSPIDVQAVQVDRTDDILAWEAFAVGGGYLEEADIDTSSTKPVDEVPMTADEPQVGDIVEVQQELSAGTTKHARLDDLVPSAEELAALEREMNATDPYVQKQHNRREKAPRREPDENFEELLRLCKEQAEEIEAGLARRRNRYPQNRTTSIPSNTKPVLKKRKRRRVNDDIVMAQEQPMALDNPEPDLFSKRREIFDANRAAIAKRHGLHPDSDTVNRLLERIFPLKQPPLSPEELLQQRREEVTESAIHALPILEDPAEWSLTRDKHVTNYD